MCSDYITEPSNTRKIFIKNTDWH